MSWRVATPHVRARELALALSFVGAGLPDLPAQRGDRPGEAQPRLPSHASVPPAPARTPGDELATMQVAAGFRVELLAAEPLIADPVAAAFDASGRLWVVEMRGYMPDLDATGERAPVGRVVVLQDADGDGRVDVAHPFLEELVLPRAVLPLRDGALVVAPPQLLWCPDADGDGRADRREEVVGGFEAGLDNPEHAGNGLLWGLDHRIHLANDPRRLRWTPAGFQVEVGAGGGQWGISHDDRGRLFFNYNEDWLRCDLVPGRHGPRAAVVGGLPQLNWRVVAERTVWPVRPTPGVNRGYQPGRLVDGRLATHTAVCGPHVYRGGLLPDADGDVFVCEPAGNLVRRIRLTQLDGGLRGGNPYEAERAEFLASTDERFRPVQLLTGLDGSLLVVDMYRGVIQHRNFVTTFLREQIEQRGLDRPIGLGRIWRIVPASSAVPRVGLDLARAGPAQLLVALADGNGAVRDLAMREIVLRHLVELAEPLRTCLRDGARPAHRLVALSVLAGLERLTTTDVRAALRDPDVGVAAFALTVVAPSLASGDRWSWSMVEHHATTGAPTLRWHAALALGEVLARRDAAAARQHERCRALLVQILLADPADESLRAAAAAAAGTEHLPWLVAGCLQTVPEAVLAADPWPAALRDLARRSTLAREAVTVSALLRTLERAPAIAIEPLLHGMLDALPVGPRRAGSLPLVHSAPLVSWAKGEHAWSSVATELLAAATMVGAGPAPAVVDLTASEQEQVRRGAGSFARSYAIIASRSPGLHGANPTPQLPITKVVTPCQEDGARWESHTACPS